MFTSILLFMFMLMFMLTLSLRGNESAQNGLKILPEHDHNL
jgi:hypothetical protein